MEAIDRIGVGNVYPHFKYGDVSEVTAKQENGELEFHDPDYELFADNVQLYHPYHVYEGDPSLLRRPATQHVVIRIVDDDGDDGKD